MDKNLGTLILIPLLLSQLCFLNKKHYGWFFIIQILGSILCLEQTILIPISDKIYNINLGIFNLKFMCDIYSYFFGILISLAFILTTFYSHSYFKHPQYFQHKNKFFFNIFLTILFGYANCYSANLETLFLFYFLMILYTAPIILIKINRSTLKAHKLYLNTHLIGSLLLLAPALLILKYYNLSTEFSLNNHNNWAEHKMLGNLVLALIVFGITKNCTLPFHQWITRTTVAPTPLSALLHSVSAVKSGSLAIIKIVIYIFSLEYTKELTNHFFSGGWVFYLCGTTAIYSAYRAYKTTKIKYRFAYSTISQLSYIMSSIFVANKIAIMGAVLHIISHSFCKIVLFFIAGIFSNIYDIHSTKDASKMAPNIKFWIACLTFCGASIIGIPYLPGSFGKEFMINSEISTHHYSAVIFLLCGSVINIFYIFPIFKSAFFTKNSNNSKQLKTVPLTMKIAIIGGISLSILMSIFISNLINFFKEYDV